MRETQIKNVKVQKIQQQADRMLTAIEEDPEAFASNWSTEHGHSSVVQSIAFSNSGRFFVTVGHNEVKFWQMKNIREAHVYTTLKLQEGQPLRKKIARGCISDDGQMLILTRGDLNFSIWNVKQNGEVV